MRHSQTPVSSLSLYETQTPVSSLSLDETHTLTYSVYTATFLSQDSDVVDFVDGVSQLELMKQTVLARLHLFYLHGTYTLTLTLTQNLRGMQTDSFVRPHKN